MTLALLALLPRLCLVGFRLLQGQPPDLYEYDDLARNLLAGKGYLYFHYGTPYLGFHSSFPYVFLTAFIYRLTGFSQTAVLMVQCLMGAALAFVIRSLGIRIVGKQGGGFAGTLTALHPGLLYYDTHKLHPLSFDALAVACATLALWQLFTAPSLRRFAAAGFLSGLALLERGTFIPVIPVCVAVLFWKSENKRAVFRGTLVFFVGLSFLTAPWILRNNRIFGVPVLMTTIGEHLWRGNNPNATGTSLTREGMPMIQTADPRFQEQLNSLHEMGQMRLFLDAGRRYIAEHPGRFVKNIVKRVFYFFWFSPTAGALYPAWAFVVYRAYYAAMLLFAGWGMASLHRQQRMGLFLVGGVWLCVGLMQSFFYVETRHRWGVEGLMLIFSAAGILRFYELGKTSTNP
ncbi:MAG: glycosyltransferase family 39 protein [Candidatus Omnitrophica bacterium]|nr:glycosyltransferase family 39 protein [Candidatus Omnitrophota bacterium]